MKSISGLIGWLAVAAVTHPASAADCPRPVQAPPCQQLPCPSPCWNRPISPPCWRGREWTRRNDDLDPWLWGPPLGFGYGLASYPVLERHEGAASTAKKSLGSANGWGRISLKATKRPFQSEDVRLMGAIEQRWHCLLDESPGLPRAGKVVLEFELDAEGRVLGLKEISNRVGAIQGLLCQRAVLDPAPYTARRSEPQSKTALVGGNMTVTFTYY